MFEWITHFAKSLNIVIISLIDVNINLCGVKMKDILKSRERLMTGQMSAAKLLSAQFGIREMS
jgi:hypothetical protein